MNFSNKIWKTKKSRINTSERFKSNDFISQVLIVYYSLFIIIVTVVDIQNKEFNFEVFTLILSITLLIVSVFILSMNFKERSLKLQNCYIKLDKIYREMEIKEDNNHDISQLKSKYYNILDLTENHTTCDFLKVEFEVRNENKQNENDSNKKQYDNKPFTWDKWILLGICIFKRYVLISFFFLIPIIVLICVLT